MSRVAFRYSGLLAVLWKILEMRRVTAKSCLSNWQLIIRTRSGLRKTVLECDWLFYSVIFSIVAIPSTRCTFERKSTSDAPLP